MNVLMVLTSHDELGNTGRKTGFWLEELAAPYYAFQDAGADVVLASPKGGRPPLDPKSNEPAFRTDLTRRFEADAAANAQLAATVRLDRVSQANFDTAFYPGGHGPLWDLAEDRHSIALIEAFLAAGKPVALVCHAPGVLRHVTTPDGRPVVEGKWVTGFTNTEEAGVGLTEVVPFLVEDELKAKGGIYSKAEDWAPYVVRDGLLITGQNPASSGPAASVLLEQLAQRSARVPSSSTPSSSIRGGRRAPAAMILLTLATGLLAGGSLGACATPRASTTAYKTLPAKASPADVQVFADARPSRAYEEIGLIEVSKFGKVDYGRLIARAREEAAKIGADAILVTRENQVVSTNTTGGVSGPTKRGGRTVNSSTTTLERPRVTVTAIAWSAR
jgi:putative intracellular protease/amidase